MTTKQETLVAESLMQDPALLQAKEQILKTVAKYRQKIDRIKGPSAQKEANYQETIKRFGALRGQNLLYPYLGSGLGNGALVELADGSVKYDFISGIGTHFGHSLEQITSEMIDAACQNTVMQGHLQQNLDSVALTKLLVDNSCLDHCFLSSSGAMACENGLKLIFHQKPTRRRLLAFEKCFMGRTLALAQITDKPEYRKNLPLNVQVDYIPFYDEQAPEKSTALAVKTLKKHLARYPNQYAAMCFECIQGEGGYWVGSRPFFMALIEVLKEENIAVFIDEVQTFGRGPTLFAHEYFELQEHVDLVAVGKLLQTCATLYKSEFKPEPGLISQTYTSSTSAIRSAHHILHTLLKDQYLGQTGKNMQLRRYFVEGLQKIEKKSGAIQGPYGWGLMIACTPFGGDRQKVLQLAHDLFALGLICFVAGKEPTRLRFLVPAAGIGFDDIDGALTILQEGLAKQ